jgi:hypothetical protein
VLYSSQTSTGLKGARKLQGVNGVVEALSNGLSNSFTNVQNGVDGVDPDGAGTNSENTGASTGGTGNSFGNGNGVGTSNGFIMSTFGQAVASGTAGGNSTAETNLSLLSTNNGAGTDAANALLGGGLSFGTLNSAGQGKGTAGGSAVFGPSLAAAVAAATPVAAPPAEEQAATPAPVVEEESKNGKNKNDKNKNNNNNNNIVTAPAEPAAPTAPAFNFNLGLPTGGGGGGLSSGYGMTGGSLNSPENGADDAGNEQFFADEAYGDALANGFGFGVGSAVAINGAGEQAGGMGGSSSLGQGTFKFELDDIQAAQFDNSGQVDSSGSGMGFVGLNAPNGNPFGATP